MITNAQLQLTFPALQDKYTKAVDELLQTGIRLAEPEQSSEYFRISFISKEPCQRALLLSSLYPPESNQPKNFDAVMSDGTWRHKKIDSWLQSVHKKRFLHLKLESQVLNKTHWMSGHFDAICGQFLYKPLSDLGQILIDFKGMHDYQYGKLTKPLRKHYLQIQLYLHETKTEWGFILYENKDRNTRKIFRFPYNFAHIEPILQKLIYLKSLRETFLKEGDPQVLPNREPGSWCNHCSWKQQCFIFRYGKI